MTGSASLDRLKGVLVGSLVALFNLDVENAVSTLPLPGNPMSDIAHLLCHCYFPSTSKARSANESITADDICIWIKQLHDMVTAVAVDVDETSIEYIFTCFSPGIVSVDVEVSRHTLLFLSEFSMTVAPLWSERLWKWLIKGKVAFPTPQISNDTQSQTTIASPIDACLIAFNLHSELLQQWPSPSHLIRRQMDRSTVIDPLTDAYDMWQSTRSVTRDVVSPPTPSPIAAFLFACCPPKHYRELLFTHLHTAILNVISKPQAGTPPQTASTRKSAPIATPRSRTGRSDIPLSSSILSPEKYVQPSFEQHDSESLGFDTTDGESAFCLFLHHWLHQSPHVLVPPNLIDLWSIDSTKGEMLHPSSQQSLEVPASPTRALPVTFFDVMLECGLLNLILSYCSDVICNPLLNIPPLNAPPSTASTDGSTTTTTTTTTTGFSESTTFVTNTARLSSALLLAVTVHILLPAPFLLQMPPVTPSLAALSNTDDDTEVCIFDTLLQVCRLPMHQPS